MNFSIVTDMLGIESFEEALKVAKNLDFDYVDLRAKLDGDTIDSITEEKARDLRKKVEYYGLKVMTLTSWAVNRCAFSGPPHYDNYDENHHQAMTKELDRLMGLAEAFDAKNIRMYSLYRSPDFDQLPSDEKEKQYKHNAEILSRHAKYVTEKGFTLMAENEPPTLTNSVVELGKLMKQANHSGLKLNWDIVNGWRSGEYPTADLYNKHLKGHVASVHLKGAYQMKNTVSDKLPEGRFDNFATAGIDDFKHEEIMRALVDGDPDVVLSIDTHYPEFHQEDQIGPVEVVRQTKEYFESILNESVVK